VATLPDGAAVDILQVVSGDAVDGSDKRWFRVRYAAAIGYLYAPLLKTGIGTNSSMATVNVDSGSSGLVRASPTRSSAIVQSLPNGAIVTMLKAVDGEIVPPGDGRWYFVIFETGQGYIYGGILSP
jgi:hypothetical protein